MTPQTQQLEQLDPAEVRARIRGRVTAPGDAEYDADRDRRCSAASTPGRR